MPAHCSSVPQREPACFCYLSRVFTDTMNFGPHSMKSISDAIRETSVAVMRLC